MYSGDVWCLKKKFECDEVNWFLLFYWLVFFTVCVWCCVWFMSIVAVLIDVILCCNVARVLFNLWLTCVKCRFK